MAGSWYLWLKFVAEVVDYEDIMAGNGCFGLDGLDMTGIAYVISYVSHFCVLCGSFGSAELRRA
jgi:hypothetical protein